MSTIGDDLTSGATDADTTATLLPSHPFQRSSVTVWTLSNDNPSNTRILGPDGQVLYDIRPDFDSKRTYTYMRRMAPDGGRGDVFGFIEWHDYLPDKISFHGGEKVRKNSFFSSAGPMSYALTFKEGGIKYTWKGVGTGLQVALHADDSPNPKIPIAQFRMSGFDRSTDPPTSYPAQLFLAPRAVEVQELVLFTFLVVEKGRRAKGNSEGNRMDSFKAGASMGRNGASIGDGVGPGVKR